MSLTLVTGATGFLGREVVRALRARDPAIRLVALIRAPDDAALERRCRSLGTHVRPAIGRGVAVGVAPVTAVRGDVSAPAFGLERRSWDTLVAQVDRVVHVAATTRFDLPLVEARRQNVDGTREVIRFCRRLRAFGNSGRLDHVSTAYVAGDRRDVVAEDELEAGQVFRNTYERSKYEAEQLCWQARAELPVAIHRPSIIVGSARTGATTSFKALYWPLEVLLRFYGLAPTVLPRLVPLPLHPDCSLDIVPVDWVAEAIAALHHRPEAAGRCHHLAAGAGAAATVAQLARLCGEHFGVEPPRFAAARGPLMRLARAGGPLLRLVAPRFARHARAFHPYSVQNPRFDVTNTRAAGLAPPPVAAYFSRLLAFAEATDFGRRPAPASAVGSRVPFERGRFGSWERDSVPAVVSTPRAASDVE